MHALAWTRRRTLFALTPLLLPMEAVHAATIGSGGFAAITLRGGIDLVVRQGARAAVQVSADDNLLPLLQTTVEGSGESCALVIQWVVRR
jgi:Putative auto-transporter adhesin, head GIN domain